MEDLLQELELTLATTVAKCKSKEAAKKNQSQMIVQEQETEMAAALHNPQPQHNKVNLTHVHDVEEYSIRLAAFIAQRITKFVLAVIRWAI